MKLLIPIYLLIICQSFAWSQSYCTANLYSVGCAQGDDVGYFSLGALTNTSDTCANGGYRDYTYLTTSLQAGDYHQFTLGSNSTDGQRFAIFIDFNKDFDFDDTGERVIDGTTFIVSPNVMIDSFAIPDTIIPGTYRLRVRSSYGGPIWTGCQFWTRGETEDYTLEVTPRYLNEVGISNYEDFYYCDSTKHYISASLTGYSGKWIDSVQLTWTIDGASKSAWYIGGIDSIHGVGNPVTIVLDSLIPQKDTTYSVGIWISSQNDNPENDTTEYTIRSGLHGTYLIGTGGDFASPQEAAEALNLHGICDSVQFLVQPGFYYGQMQLTEIAGSASDKPIVFDGIDSSQTTISYMANSSSDRHTVLINGSDWVAFKNLTIEAKGQLYGHAIHLLNEANHNTFSSLNISLDTTVFSWEKNGIVFSADLETAAAPGNNGSYNTVEECKVKGGNAPVIFAGGTIIYGKKNKIVHSIFEDVFGVYVSRQDSFLFYGNQVFSSNSNGQAFSGYHINNIQLNNNHLRGGSYGLYLYEVENDTSFDGVVYNNLLIGEEDGGFFEFSPGFILTYNTFLGGNRGLHLKNSGNFNLRNNIFSGSSYSVYSSAWIPPPQADYNIYHGWVEIYTLTSYSQWKTYYQNSNQHSLEGNPFLFADGHTFGDLANGAADNSVGIFYDVDGELRDTSAPDIGADEFTPFNHDVAVSSLFCTDTLECLDLDSLTLIAVMWNHGSGAESLVPYSISYNGVIVSTGNVSLPYTFVPDTLLFKAPVPKKAGPYQIELTTSLATDQYSQNNSATSYFHKDSIISSFPFTEDFEGISPAWFNDSIDSGEDWIFSHSVPLTDIPFDHTIGTPNGKFAFVNVDSPFVTPINLISFCIDLSNLKSPMLDFWWWNNSNSPQAEFHVDLYHNNMEGSYMSNYTYLGFQMGKWQHAEMPLDSFSNQVIRIALKATEKQFGALNDLGLDDIRISSSQNIGIKSELNDLTIVYPNPTSGLVYVSASLSEIKQVKMYHASGRLVRNLSQVDLALGVIDLTNLTPGIYVMALIKSDNIIVTKIILE